MGQCAIILLAGALAALVSVAVFAVGDSVVTAQVVGGAVGIVAACSLEYLRI